MGLVFRETNRGRGRPLDVPVAATLTDVQANIAMNIVEIILMNFRFI